MRSWFLLPVVAILGAATARADVVHLQNGARIQGELIEEDSHQVVVKTPKGRITIPRRKVHSIERESKAVLLLAQARDLIGSDRGKARIYLKRALEAGDPAVAREAREELDRLGPVSREAPEAPADPGSPFTAPEPEALVRELEAQVAGGADQLRGRLVSLLFSRGTRRHQAGEHRLAVGDFRRAGECSIGANRLALATHEQRCRLEVAAQAVRRGDGPLAVLAAAPVPGEASGRTRLRGHYLLGRGRELLGQRDAARQSYQEVLGSLRLAPSRDLATFRELARLASVGVPIDANSPGVADGWRWVRTRNFAVLHRLGGSVDVAQRLEVIRREVIDRLRLRGRLDEREQIAVFLFDDEADYRASQGAQAWSAGHAQRIQAGDELIRVIYLQLAGFERTARHEVAHVLLGDALDDAVIPAWAAEGAAVYAEPSDARGAWTRNARLLQGGQLRPLEAAASQMLAPGPSMGRSGIIRFYVQSAVMFAALARRLGVERALELVRHINDEGPDGALRRMGLDFATFSALVSEVLKEGL